MFIKTAHAGFKNLLQSLLSRLAVKVNLIKLLKV